MLLAGVESKEEMMGEKGGNCAVVPEEKGVLIRRILSQVQGKEAKASTWNSGSQWGGRPNEEGGRRWVGLREEGEGERAPLASNKKALTYHAGPRQFSY